MKRNVNIYKEENKENGIVKGALSLTLSMIIVKLLGLLYKIPLSYILMDEGMGAFNSAYTVYTFFFLICNAGVPKAITVLTAKSRICGRIDDERKIFTTALWSFGIFGALLSFLFLFLSVPISNLIGNSAAGRAMIAVAPSVFFIALSGVIRGNLNGKASLVPIAVSQVVEGASKLVLGLCLAMLAARLGLAVEEIASFAIFGVTLGSFFGLLYLWFEIKISNKDIKIEQKCESGLKNREILKSILGIAVPITLGAAVMSLTNMIDLGIVMRRLREIGYSEAEAGALYGNYTTLAVSMFNFVAALITPLTMALLPSMAERYAASDRQGFQLLVRNGMEICAFISIPAAFGFMAFSEQILRLLFEDSSAKTAAPLLVLLAPAVIFMAALTVVNTALEGAGRVKSMLLSMAVGAALKLAVSYHLVGNLEYGISGAPIGTTVFYAGAFITSVIIMSVSGKITFSVFLGFLRPCINAALSVAIVKFVSENLKKSLGHEANILVLIAICALLYLVFSAITGALGVFFEKYSSKCTKTVEKC